MEVEKRNKPAFGMLTPLTASRFPNSTVRLLEDVGSKPGGVKANAAPPRATVMRALKNVFLSITNEVEAFTQIQTQKMAKSQIVKIESSETE